jgi:hypothetical protein
MLLLRESPNLGATMRTKTVQSWQNNRYFGLRNSTYDQKIKGKLLQWFVQIAAIFFQDNFGLAVSICPYKYAFLTYFRAHIFLERLQKIT